MSKSPVQLKIKATPMLVTPQHRWLKIDWSGPLTVDWFYRFAEIGNIRAAARRLRADPEVLDDAFSRGQVSKVPTEGGQS